MMRQILGVLVMVALVGAAALLPTAPARADGPTTFVVFTPPTGSLAGPPVPLLTGPAPVGTIPSTTGSGPGASTLPPVVLLAANPQTGAYLIQVGTTTPSLPGVTLYGPQVLVPPVSVPGQNPVLVLTGLLQSALPAGTYIVLPVH
jgi:hypothetical protein